MPLDFPSSPTNGQTYTSAGKTYTYNSAKGVWLLTTSASATTGGGTIGLDSVFLLMGA